METKQTWKMIDGHPDYSDPKWQKMNDVPQVERCLKFLRKAAKRGPIKDADEARKLLRSGVPEAIYRQMTTAIEKYFAELAEPDAKPK